MTRIALISDVHSNLYALQAVLEDIKKREIDTIYCLGDIVGYHTSPNETIDLIKKSNIICILGNHDDDVINKRFNDEKDLDIFRWTYEALEADNIKFLQDLPRSLSLNIEGHKIELYHGSPRKINEYLREGEQLTDDIMADFNGDILVCAHTHLPYLKKYDQKTIINTGSVGKPKIGRPNATYQMLELDEDFVLAEIIELSYDVDSMANMVEEHGFVKYANALRTGCA